MNNIYAENGGRPRKVDDLLLMQSEFQNVSKGLFTNLGAMIVYGCNVTVGSSNYNISSGLVFCDDNFLIFNGATEVPLPFYIYSDIPVLQEYLPYEDGVSRATRQFFGATGSNTIPVSGQFISMTTGGGRTWAQAQNSWVTLSGTQTVNGNKTFTGNETFSGSNNFTNNNNFSGGLNVGTTGDISVTGAISATNGFSSGNAINLNNHKVINILDGSSAHDAVSYQQFSSITNSLSTSLSNETTNRINADNSLNGFIVAETAARIAGDAGKANVSNGAWINLPLTAPTVATNNVPQYRINQFGNLEFRGSATGTTTLNGTYTFLWIQICNLASMPTVIKNAINGNTFFVDKFINGPALPVTLGVFLESAVPAYLHMDTTIMGINATVGFLTPYTVSSPTSYSYIITFDGISINLNG